MANTKALSLAERKKSKREARQKNKALFIKLSKANRKKFLVQVRDNRAKSKLGIVAFVESVNKEAQKAESVEQKPAENKEETKES